MRFSGSLIVVLASFALGCGDPAGSTPSDAARPDAGTPPIDADVPPSDAGLPDAPPPADAGAPDAPPPGDAGPPPSAEFVALYETVIVRHCGGSECHAPGTNESSYFGYRPALQMPDPATARAVLVDRRLECMFSGDDRVRVVPFDPAASAIMTAAEDGLCGRRHNQVVPALTADDLAMIEAWIAGGAL